MRSSLRRSYLLGEFDLVSRVRIHLHAHESSDQVVYTETHELSHRSLASSTTHGHVQQLLALVITQIPSRGVPWVSKADVVLDEVLDASWSVDEGYAVFREFDLQQRHSLKVHFATLQPDYRVAYELITSPLTALGSAFHGFEWLVVRALAEAALNTEVLRQAPFDDLFPDAVSALMRDAAYRPDDRLRQLVAALARNPFSKDLGWVVHQQVTESAIVHGLPTDVPPAELYRRATESVTEQNLDFIVDVDRRLTEPLEHALAAICPEVRFVGAYDAHRIRQAHSEAGRIYAGRCGLEMPAQQRPTHAELAISRTDVEYEIANPLSTTHFPHPLAAGVAVEAMVEHYRGFIITVGPASVVLEQPWLTLLVIPLERVPDSPPSADHWILSDHRIRVFGPAADVETWFRRLRLHPVVALLDDAALDLENWTAHPAVSALKPLPVVVFPYSKGSWLLAFLRRWRTLGVRGIAPIGLTGDRLLHLLVRLSTGIDVVIRMSLYLMGVLRVHYPDVYAFLEQEMERTDPASLPTRAFLDLLVAGDRAGAFSPARETDEAIFIDAPFDVRTAKP